MRANDVLGLFDWGGKRFPDTLESAVLPNTVGGGEKLALRIGQAEARSIGAAVAKRRVLALSLGQLQNDFPTGEIERGIADGGADEERRIDGEHDEGGESLAGCPHGLVYGSNEVIPKRRLVDVGPGAFGQDVQRVFASDLGRGSSIGSPALAIRDGSDETVWRGGVFTDESDVFVFGVFAAGLAVEEELHEVGLDFGGCFEIASPRGIRQGLGMNHWLSFLLFFFAVSLIHAAEPKVLFDGTSLDGWTSNEETPGCFTLTNGMLRISNGPAHLFYDGPEVPFSDFELKVEMKTEPLANSGVYLHTKFQETGWPEQGVEAQVAAAVGDPRKTGTVTGFAAIWVPEIREGKEARVPWVQTIANGETQARHPASPHADDEWFTYTIRLRGNRIETRVNDQVLVRTVIDDPTKLPGGTIALQAHDPKSTVWVKSVTIRIAK